MSTSSSVPGFNTPAVGFDQPFEMLHACHDRVQRSLALLDRLMQHVEARGHDAQSRSAVGDVLRYFDLAAPHHHEDEERHVFPVLAESADAAVRDAVARLRGDHQRMEQAWAALRPVLIAWRDDAAAGPITPEQRALAAAFSSIYDDHIALEQDLVFPAAQVLIGAAQAREMGDEMAARRRSV